MRALVTGATGRIGSALVPLLLGAGHRVTALVEPGDRRRQLLPPQVDVVVGSLESAKALRRALDGVEAVAHLAALTAPGRGRPREYFASILDGTFGLLDAVARSGGVRRFVYASSVSIYFAYPDRPPRFTPVTEAHPPQPSTAYGAAKMAAECLVLAAWRERALPALVLRLANTIATGEIVAHSGTFARSVRLGAAREWYGRPGPRLRWEREAHRVLTAVAAPDDSLLAVADAAGRSPVLEVADRRDVAAAFALGLEEGAPAGLVLNVGPRAPYAQAHLARHLGERLGLEVVPVTLPGMGGTWTTDSARARHLLGYQPLRTTFTMVDEAAPSRTG